MASPPLIYMDMQACMHIALSLESSYKTPTDLSVSGRLANPGHRYMCMDAILSEFNTCMHAYI